VRAKPSVPPSTCRTEAGSQAAHPQEPESASDPNQTEGRAISHPCRREIEDKSSPHHSPWSSLARGRVDGESPRRVFPGRVFPGPAHRQPFFFIFLSFFRDRSLGSGNQARFTRPGFGSSSGIASTNRHLERLTPSLGAGTDHRAASLRSRLTTTTPAARAALRKGRRA
jgi:hypothetical protein